MNKNGNSSSKSAASGACGDIITEVPPGGR